VTTQLTLKIAGRHRREAHLLGHVVSCESSIVITAAGNDFGVSDRTGRSGRTVAAMWCRYVAGCNEIADHNVAR